jgi:hypothetical protein
LQNWLGGDRNAAHKSSQLLVSARGFQAWRVLRVTNGLSGGRR